MTVIPRPFPQEFRDDVVRVANSRGPGVTRDQIAKDFGIHVGTLDKWLREARVQDSHELTGPRTDNAELRELRQRNRLLEQEAVVLRRAVAYMFQSHLPEKGSTRS